MGGVVNVLTRPIDRRSAEFYFQGGNSRTTTAYGRASARITPRLGMSLSYEDQRTNGYANQDALRTATDSTATGGTPVTGISRALTRTGGVNYAVGVRATTGSSGPACARGEPRSAPPPSARFNTCARPPPTVTTTTHRRRAPRAERPSTVERSCSRRTADGAV
ncbi:MAG: hypothetical protein R2712_24770 [Vicinamibacterales bacterium]